MKRILVITILLLLRVVKKVKIDGFFDKVMVFFHVASSIKDQKVIRRVVSFITIDVMDYLRRFKFSTKFLFHNKTMLRDVFLSFAEHNVSFCRESFAASPTITFAKHRSSNLFLVLWRKLCSFRHSHTRSIAYILGMSIAMLALTTTIVFGADQKVVIRDPDSSGRQVEVRKIGASDALSVMIHSKGYMICNKDDDGTPNFYGFEAADGSWMIIKETVSAGADVYEYNSGTSGYAAAWAIGTTATYQSWGSEF